MASQSFTDVRFLPVVSKPASKSRRTTCDVCRDRKVRCDREQPKCERCRRLNLKCTYTPSTDTLDVPQTLFLLHERLAQAEAALAASISGSASSQPRPQPPSQLQDHGKESLSSPFSNLPLGLDDPIFGDGFYSQNTPGAWEDFPANPLMSGVTPAPSTLVDTSRKSVDWFKAPFTGGVSTHPMFKSQQQSTTTTSCLSSTNTKSLDQSILHVLHQRYFDATQPIPSIINRDRFFCLATEIPIPHQVNALRYAVAMAGASLSDDLPHLESLCYNSTRHYIELAEREDDGASFLNLEMLQALILIERHEFMEATTSARAWMTHGRTMRLVKLLGLHVMDADSAPMELNRLCIPHSASPSPTDLDERRRTFWVAFNLDLFIAAMTNTPPSIEVDEIFTKLPHDIQNGVSVPSPIVSATLIGNRALKHLKLAADQEMCSSSPVYDFWTNHFDLDNTIRESLVRSPFSQKNPLTGEDPLVVVSHLLLLGVVILIHMKSFSRAQQTGFPSSLSDESRQRMENAATEIGDVFRRGGVFDRVNMKICHHINMYLMWPVSLAAKVQLQRINDDQIATAAGNVTSLSALASAYPSPISAQTPTSSYASLRLLDSTLRILKGSNTHLDDLLEGIRLALESSNQNGLTTVARPGIEEKSRRV